MNQNLDSRNITDADSEINNHVTLENRDSKLSNVIEKSGEEKRSKDPRNHELTPSQVTPRNDPNESDKVSSPNIESKDSGKILSILNRGTVQYKNPVDDSLINRIAQSETTNNTDDFIDDSEYSKSSLPKIPEIRKTHANGSDNNTEAHRNILLSRIQRLQDKIKKEKDIRDENLNSYLNLTHHPITQLPVTSSSVDPSHVVRKSFQKRNHLIADRLNRYEKRLRETFSELEMCTCAPPPRPLRPMASVPLSSKIVESREFAIGDQSGSSKNRTRMFRSECGKGNGRIDQSEKRQNSFGDSHRSDIGKIKGSDNSTGQSESAKLVQSENSNSSADFSKKRSAGDVKQGGSLDRARQAPPIPLPPLSTHHHSGFHWFMDKEISRMKTRKKELAHMFKKFGSLDHLHPSAVTQINPTNLNTSIVTGKAKFRIDMAKNGATGDVTNILSSDYNGHLAPLPEPDTYQNDPTHPNYSSSIHTSSQLSTASSTPSSLSGKENNNSSTFYIGSGYLAQPPTHKTSSSVHSVKSSNSQDRRFNPPASSPDKTALAPEKYGSKQTLGSHHALITPFNPNPIVAHDQDHNAPNILAGNGASNNLTNNRDMVENEANLEDGKYSGEILDHSPSKQQKELDYYGNQIPTQQGQNYQMQYQGQLEKLAQQQNQDRRNLDSLRIKNQQDFASFNESMSEIGFRCENLNEQITDIVELQQSETENLRLEIKALEEKMSYQIDDRTQDILEMMENIQTRISKLELAQQRQQIGSLEGLEMSAARNLLLKFINILLAFLQLVLLLTSTFATILSPFVKTRSRTFVTLIVSLCVALLLKTNPNFQRQCINLIHRLFLMPSHKS